MLLFEWIRDKTEMLMEKTGIPDIRVGIIAGGQLGKMLIQEASKWDISTFILDDDEDCPASNIASKHIIGSRFNFDDVYRFGKMVDVLTFEIESVNIDALQKLKSEGHRIVPDPDVLELLQDKGLQKQFYADNGITTAHFQVYDTAHAILNGIEKGTIEYPFVQKLRNGGYDGRGVAVIHNETDLPNLLEGPSLVEEKVDIVKELSIIAARNGDGECKCYPVVEMVFDPEANLVDKLFCPSSISSEQADKAVALARRIIEGLNMEGMLAVELFVDSKGEVLVNEIAPRPHNSGHHTIESILTSQFEQHLRAILNLPLGSTEQILPSVMINILGSCGYEGPVRYEGLSRIMAIEGAKLHLYGKKITRPYRKMGHITVLSSSLESALKKAEKVRTLIGVTSWGKN